MSSPLLHFRTSVFSKLFFLLSISLACPWSRHFSFPAPLNISPLSGFGPLWAVLIFRVFFSFSFNYSLFSLSVTPRFSLVFCPVRGRGADLPRFLSFLSASSHPHHSPTQASLFPTLLIGQHLVFFLAHSSQWLPRIPCFHFARRVNVIV